MSELLKKNLASLQNTNPLTAEKIRAADSSSITVLDAKSGGKVPQIDRDGKKILIHSRFDPVVEAGRFLSDIGSVSYALYAVAGFGFGYHIEQIYKAMPSDSTLLVLEKEAALLRSAAENRDLSALFGDERFILLCDPTEDDIAVRMKGRSSKNSVFIAHRGSCQLYGDFYTNAIRIAKSYISSKDANVATLAKFEKLWSSNITRNARVFLSSPALSSFFGAFENMPALVVGAGPSLTESIPFIKKMMNCSVVISVDTAYFVLRRFGIEPHFCVCADPQTVNARYFEGDTPSKTILVADPCVHPSVFRFFRGRVLSASIPFDMMKWIEDVSGGKGELAHGGSVSTNAFDFARQLGARPLILAGQDLSFSAGLAHARGSYLDEQVHHRITRLYNAQMMNRFQLSALPPVYVKSIDGKKVRTNQKMVLFMGWFEKQADAHVINATRAGAYITGMKHQQDDSIDFAEQKDIQKKIDALYESSRIENTHVDSMISDLSGRISDMASSAEELKKKLDQGVDFAEELCTLMRSDPGNGGRIRYILGKLGDIDEYLHTSTGAKDMVGLTVQRVIHTVTEGYDPGDEAISDQHAVALRSRFLYKGLREGCVFSLKYLYKMKRMLA